MTVGAGVAVLDVGQHALQGLVDLGGFVGAAFVDALLEDVGCGPEHTERGVAAFVGGVERTYGVVGFLDLALTAQLEYLFDGHLVVKVKGYRLKRFD